MEQRFEIQKRKILLGFISILCLLAAFLTGCADEQDSGIALRRAFEDPPSEFRPVIVIQSRALKDQGLPDWLDERNAGGMVFEVGWERGKQRRLTDPNYLNDPKLFERLREVIAQLKDRGRVIWIYDELGYPSASAGGRVLQGHPEYQVWAVGCRNFKADNGQIEVELKHEYVEACLALPYRGEVLSMAGAIDLTEKARSGSFTWKTPEGDWLVCLFEKYQPDTWKRHNIPRRNVNIMDRDAVARFIEITHERYAKELGSQLKDVTLFFTDEPQFGATEPWMFGKEEAVPAVQWCDEMPQAFEQKKGYALSRVLPALFHDVGPETSRFRYDFYDVQSDLVAENYFGQIQDWCHRHGVWSSGHMLLEESLLFHLMWAGSMVKNWSRMDLPGVDLLRLPRYKTMGWWNRDIVVPVKEDFTCKMAASIARLTGKQGVFTESYAAARNATVQQVKGIAAWQFVCGVTHMSTYSIQNQLSAQDYAAFADFTGRLALFCRRGQPVSDVAVLVPEASVWAAYNPPDGGLFPRYFQRNPDVMRIDDVFRQTCHQLLAHQRDFEILSEDLLRQAKISKGRLELAGQSFAFLILPEVRMLSEASLDHVAEFLKAGGHVIFVGSLPSQNPMYGEDAGIRKKAEALLASAKDRTRHMPELEDFGELISWMAEKVHPVIRWDGSSAVRVMHLHEAEREVILIANPSAEDAEGSLITEFAGKVSLWNPETGVIENMGRRERAEAIALLVPADSARFIVFEP